MKRQIIFYAMASLSFTLLLYGCKDKDKDVSISQGTIYGTITDFATGEPVHNANVQLRPSGETTLTGSDGTYEFIDIEDGNYSITVSKAEYTDLIDDYVIQVKNGRKMRRDVQIEKIPTYIRFTDMQGNDVTELDFGSNPSFDMLAFNIYNNGVVTISCKVEYSCNWIKSVSQVPSSLKPGQNVLVSIQIDRSKLKAGENVNYLYITSNNGSNMIKIKAYANATPPSVLTLPATDSRGNSSPWCDTFHARVTNAGNPAYTKRGFCYSSTNQTPTINDNRIDVDGTGVGEYSYTFSAWYFPPQTQTYYFRAWVIYGNNNQIQYGNVCSFTYNDV